jgi:hypothetical protein
MYIFRRIRRVWDNLQEVFGEDLVHSIIGLLFAGIIMFIILVV